MDIFNIQAKKALGQILNLTDLDPDNTWLQIGVYSKSNAMKGISSNLYPAYIIKVSDFLNTGYYSIEDEGVSLPKQHIIDFVGPGVSSYDDPLNNKTVVFVPAAAYGSAGLFAQIANSTPITNTITLGNLLGSGVGTLSVPPNSFQVGDSFHLKASGIMSSKNNNDITITIRSNGNILASTGSINLPQTTNKVWELEADFTIKPSIDSVAVTVVFVEALFAPLTKVVFTKISIFVEPIGLAPPTVKAWFI